MRVLIIHQHDPTMDSSGGISTFINSFVKHAPPDIEPAIVGVSSDPSKHAVGQWQQPKMGEREYRFLPVLAAHPTFRSRIPLTLRLLWALWRYRSRMDIRDSLLIFHRIEPSLVFRDLGNPKVLVLHGDTRDLHHPKAEIRWGRAPWLYFWIERRLIRQMAQVCIVREKAVAFYRSRYPDLAGRISFLPTWVDEDIFAVLPEADRLASRKELARAHRLDPAGPIVLFVGRLERGKDPSLLLEGFRHLVGRLPQAQLVIIGGGSQESWMRAWIAKSGLGHKVFLLGPLSQPLIARWMNSADCLLLTSAYEGMPIVVLESLQCGLPVVSTDVGEIPRLIANPACGRVVAERTPEAFQQAMADLLRQPRDPAACQRQVAPYTACKVLGQVYAAFRELRRE